MTNGMSGMHEDDELIRCPACGKLETIDGYDCLGADQPGNIFCTDCHCQITPEGVPYVRTAEDLAKDSPEYC